MKGNTGDFTFYIFMRAKETVDGNRESKNEGRGASGRGKGRLGVRKQGENYI